MCVDVDDGARMHDAIKDAVAPVRQDAVEVCVEAGKAAGINELVADGLAALAAPGETR
jgi:hypothetical protein